MPTIMPRKFYYSQKERAFWALSSFAIGYQVIAYLMVISLPERTSVFSVRVLVEDT